jgi:hypothetical protein
LLLEKLETFELETFLRIRLFHIDVKTIEFHSSLTVFVKLIYNLNLKTNDWKSL